MEMVRSLLNALFIFAFVVSITCGIVTGMQSKNPKIQVATSIMVWSSLFATIWFCVYFVGH